jgi:GSPII_E N-terminal domain.
MYVRLGDLLVRRGVLTEEQRDVVLAEQRRRGGPFGALAEELFGVNPRTVEDAWGEQYASVADHADPSNTTIDPGTLRMIERRQAWQFGVIPLRVRGEELQLVTTAANLARAMRFAGWRLACPCTFAICSSEELTAGLDRHYQVDGDEAAFLTKAIGRLAHSA